MFRDFTVLFVLTGCTVSSNMIGGNGGDEDDLEINSYTENTVPNPYKGQTESSDPWRYDVFEIFRGATVVTFDDTLQYEKKYSSLINSEEEGLPDVQHEFICQITLPQYIGNEPWKEQLNAYYQQLIPQLADEGNELWNEYIGNVDTKYLIYQYNSAYQYQNIITIVRSRAFGGWRPSSDCNAFADMFSTLDGHVLSLDDLFVVDSDVYLPVLYSALMNGTLCFSDQYNPEHVENFRPVRTTEYFEKSSVAATPFGLVFIYPTGYVSSMASGVICSK